MAITQVGAMTVAGDGTFSSPTVITRPTGVVQGDLVVVSFRSQLASAGGDATMADGFTRLILSSPSAVFYKVMGASELSQWTISHGSDYRSAVAVAFRGVSQSSPVDASAFTASGGTFPGVTSTRSGVQLALAAVGGVGVMGYPAGYTGAGTHASDPSHAAAFIVRAIGTHPGGSFTGAGGFGASVFLADANAAPNAPTLTSPVGNATIDRNVIQRFSWTFSDPDAGHTQSKYDLQYRLVGATPWTTVTGTTANNFHDFAAATFAAGAYEWQARTYDSLGLVGPYSTSAFFTAGTMPPGPTITAPVNNSTITTASTTLTWSYPTQQAHQVRVLDAADAIIYDSGVFEQPATRSTILELPTNNVTRKLQVRVRDAGLFSPYSTITVTVSYTVPATPTLTVAVNTSAGALSVTAAHPTPTGGQPTVTSVDVHRRVIGDTGDGIRVAAGRLPLSTFTDYTVASGVGYAYRVRAYGTTGASSYSAWSEVGIPAGQDSYGGLNDDIYAAY